MGTPFKMKGSPMQRNFGIGASPARDVGTHFHPHPKPEKKTSLTDKLKSAAYAIKRGFTDKSVDDHSDVMNVYKQSKKAYRKKDREAASKD